MFVHSNRYGKFEPAIEMPCIIQSRKAPFDEYRD
jgi:hypothetical protein